MFKGIKSIETVKQGTQLIRRYVFDAVYDSKHVIQFVHFISKLFFSSLTTHKMAIALTLIHDCKIIISMYKIMIRPLDMCFERHNYPRCFNTSLPSRITENAAKIKCVSHIYAFLSLVHKVIHITNKKQQNNLVL